MDNLGRKPESSRHSITFLSILNDDVEGMVKGPMLRLSVKTRVAVEDEPHLLLLHATAPGLACLR